MIIDLDSVRKKKKQRILAAYGLIILTIVVLIVFALTPGVSCTDKKMNGAETGVDCGGICGECVVPISAQEVVVEKADFVSSGNAVYDLVVWLKNPNDVYGAKSVRGSFVLYGANKELLGEVPVHTFLLPREQKYVVSQNVTTTSPIETIEWKLSGASDWVLMNELSDLRLSVTDRKYEELNSGSGFSQVRGLLRNDSAYDWNNVVISVLLFDSSGKLLATHGTSRQTFRAGERWDFQLIFPNRFPGEVRDITMQVETNVYENTNFLKANLPAGAFQTSGQE